MTYRSSPTRTPLFCTLVLAHALFTSESLAQECVWGAPGYTKVGNFGGDDKPDIASAKGASVAVSISHGDHFETLLWPVKEEWGGPDYTWTGHFTDGDFTNIASALDKNVFLKTSTGSGFGSFNWKGGGGAEVWGRPDFTWIGNFDGDATGRDDIATRKGAVVMVRTSRGFNFTENRSWTKIGNGWGQSGYSWAGDFDGDGRTDIASAVGSTVYMNLSTGSEFKNAEWLVPGVWGGPGYTWTGHFDHDALTDIASANGTQLFLHLSTGSEFTSHTWPVSNEWGGADFTWVADFNGDGKDDIASALGGNVYMKLSRADGEGFDSETWKVPGHWGGPVILGLQISMGMGRPISRQRKIVGRKCFCRRDTVSKWKLGTTLSTSESRCAA